MMCFRISRTPTTPVMPLRVTQKRSHFYENDESEFVLYASQGLMGDDGIIWDEHSGQYVLTTGVNGINQSCISKKDNKIIPRFKGQPYQKIVDAGSDHALETPALKDELQFIQIEGEKPLPKILSGDDGICNTYRIGDDRTEIFMGTGAPDYPCVKAGPNGIADTKAQGNDSQLFLVGEKTGFDSYEVETPKVVRDSEKLYMYYTGLGWMDIPRQTPGSRGGLAKNGECKRPGLDDIWGNIDTNLDLLDATTSQERNLVMVKGGGPNLAFRDALDDNQGVILAPRIGVATSTIARINANPSDWTRDLKPVVNVGGFCGSATSGVLGNFSLGGLSVSGGSSLPPIFNYYGSFSPEVIIKHHKGDDKPTFIMWLTGAYATRTQMTWRDNSEYIGITKPQFQIGLARSDDGFNFDLATDISPVIVTGDLLSDVEKALGLGGANYSYLNPTVFAGPEDDTYGMIFKMSQLQLSLFELQ